MADKTHTYEWQPTKIGRKLVRVPIDKPATAEPEPEAAPEPEPTVSNAYMTKAELVALAEERGVDSSGTRPELIERLALND